MDTIFLSIIIPAYNEERRIGKTLSDIGAYLKRVPYASEVIVVSDGSTDRTTLLADSFKGEVRNLLVLALPENRGKGAAVKAGMLKAKGAVRLFMDADGATAVSELDSLLPRLKQPGTAGEADVVIGSLGVPGAVMTETQSRFRMAFGRVSNRLIQRVVLPGIHDTQRGFKLFTKEAAEALFPLMTIHRWGFDIEILGLARRLGFTIAEAPIRWRHMSESKVTPFSYLQTLVELLVIAARLSRVKKQETTL